MTAHPGLSLANIVADMEPATPLLPLMHSTGASGFLSMLGAPLLEPRDCPVFGEPLLYFFYGRPAYRPFSRVLNTALPAFRPVCLLFRPEALTAIRRVVPLDTGALAAGLFQRHLEPGTTAEHFAIGGGVEGAARVVRAFFGSNRAYYFSRPATDAPVKPTDLIGHAYRSIIADTGIADVDDRRSTVEIQSAAAMPLTRDTLLAAALPEAFLDDDAVRDLLFANCRAEVIAYDIYADRPAHDVREIMARVKDWLAAKGYLP